MILGQKNINLEADGAEFVLDSPAGSMVIKSPRARKIQCDESIGFSVNFTCDG